MRTERDWREAKEWEGEKKNGKYTGGKTEEAGSQTGLVHRTQHPAP